MAFKKIQKYGKSKSYLGGRFFGLPWAPDSPKTALRLRTLQRPPCSDRALGQGTLGFLG